MKKILFLIIILSLSASTAFARTPFPPPEDWRPAIPCTEIPYMDPDPADTIQKVFDKYTIHTPSLFSTENNRYELCFVLERAVNIDTPISFRKQFDSKNVLIKGLKLKSSSIFPHPAFLLSVTNTDPAANVILEDINLADVKNGLKVNNISSSDSLNMELSKVIIKGDGSKEDAHTGLKIINSQYVKVKKSEFRDGHTGISIENSNHSFIGAEDAGNYEADKNLITENEFGIIVQSGSNNRFPYNSNFDNPRDVASSDYAIFIEPTLDIKRPEVILINEDNDALYCKKDSSGAVIERWLKFNPETVSPGQEMIIYETNRSHLQALNYFTKCTIGEDGKCILTTLPSTHSFVETEDECTISPEIKSVALVNASDHTSMLTSNFIKMNGPIATVGGSPMIDVPSVPGVSGGRDDVEENILDDGSNFTGDMASSSDVKSLSSGPGGCVGGGGATIVPPTLDTIVTGLGMWWIITAVPVALLCAVRIRKKK